MEKVDLLEARLKREQAARQEAERLLEEKSRQLFIVNQSLQEAADRVSAESVQLSVILDRTNFAILLSTSDGRIVRSNKMARHLFANQKEDLTGEGVLTFITFADEEEDDGLFGLEENSLSDYVGKEALEALGNTSEGGPLPLEVTVNSLDWGEGEHYMWLCRDVSRSRAIEAQKQALEQEIRHGQKLEALGTLASGIAHEINTPIQYISDNISFMQDSFEDLHTLVSGLRGLIDGLEQQHKEAVQNKVSDLLEDADFEFLEEEIPSSIEQSREGTKRVAKIVSAIKDFAHPGSEEKSSVNINEAIETTATVSHNHWKYVSNLKMDLDENLPAILGYVGDINQVLLNLVVNAAQAIEEKGADDLGNINIKTTLEGELVSVEVSDTGCGIPKANLEKIYDPFFTTKEVGKGTGQGLAIIHNIVVNKHGGHIAVSSEEGQGTTFTLQFPKATTSAQSSVIEEIS